jgi:D-alanyl-lipoteichoic acid acyltransferase DltB (MBOAT superfamily)
MLFNSVAFLVFLPIVFALYWSVMARRLWVQNLFVVIASYIFYGWWDWRFLILIAFSSVWAWGLALAHGKGGVVGHKIRMLLSLTINLGILLVCKYFNFFIDNMVCLLTSVGVDVHVSTLKIILPVGVSFYTFQALSYTIDVYRGDIKPVRNLITFLAYVSYFPQLVAGPIERATNLIPQFLSPRFFDYPRAVDGMRQMLWGFFKKVVVADSCAVCANSIFQDYGNRSGIVLLLGAVIFAFQIYCDFSAYSDIAVGTSRLFGISLMRNFANPYFSRDIAEFWRRWHISLTTWFRDYLYIPLGGSRGSVYQKIRNVCIIFLVSGFWHGANWTFVFWGLIHSCFFLPLLIGGKNRKYTDCVAAGRVWPNSQELIGMASTFLMAVFAWVFFRAENINMAVNYVWRIVVCSGGLHLSGLSIGTAPLIGVCGLMSVEWFNREYSHGLSRLPLHRWARWCLYCLLVTIIVLFKSSQQTFIYFQF